MNRTRSGRRPRRHALAVGAAALTLLLGGCASDDQGALAPAGAVSSTAPSATPSAAPEELTIATSFAITDLDPLANGFWAPEFGFGALLMKPHGGGELEPWLLESLTQPAPTSWVLTLKPGLRFHNGNALDAAALAEVMTFNLEENTALSPLLPGATAEASGPDTVTLTTAEPTVFVPSLLAHEGKFPIFDAGAYQSHRERGAGADALVEAKIWSGPYTPTSLTAEAMELVPTPGYFSEPTLTSLTVRFIPDAQARILAVRNGEADLALYPPTTAARELAGREDARYLSQPPGTGDAGFQLLINPRSGVLAEVAVRQALRDAIDYRALAEDVLDGLYDTAVGYYPAFLPYAERNQVTDPAAAAAGLDAAGWAAGSDGRRAKDGRALAFEVLSYPQQPDSQILALAIQSQLREIGFEVTIRQVEDITAAVEAEAGWNAAISGNGSLDWTASDPVAPLVSAFTADGDRNYGGIADDELMALIDELRAEFDPAARDELLREVQRIVIEDEVFALSLALKRVPVVAAPEFADYRVPPVALLFVDDYA